MKVSLILLPLTFAAINAHATNADVLDLAKKASVSSHCAQQILSQLTRQCNSESKAKEGADREHGCFYNYDLSGVNQGLLNVGFTTGDADEWDYCVFITDESDQFSCDFTVKSAN